MLTLLFWAEEEDSSRTSVIRMIRSGGDGMMYGSPIHTTETWGSAALSVVS